MTKTKQLKWHRQWTQRDYDANARLFLLTAEILHAIDAGVFVPKPGSQCRDCQYLGRCWASK